MKKKLLKSFAFVALGVFSTSAYAQSESTIQDAVVAEISSNWEKVKGMVEYQDGTGWLFGEQFDLEELAEKILNDEKAAKKYAVMLDALRNYDKAA